MTVLGQVVRRVGTWNPSRAASAEPFAYVDLSSVDQDAKRITSARSILPVEAPTRARQLVERGDVLVSTVRPNLNAVAHVGDEFHGATASTGFSVLRPTDRVDGRYLFHWVQTPDFVQDMVRRATGASYPAVSDRIVKESSLPLPPIEEQRRLAAILDQASSLRATNMEALCHVLALEQSLFTACTDNFTKLTLRDDGWDFSTGKNVVADATGEHPSNRIIKVSAVSSGVFDPSESKPMPADYSPPATHVIREGDILFGRASGSLHLLGATARVGVVPDHLYLPDKVWRLELGDSRTLPRYALALLRSKAFKDHVQQHASGAAGVRNIGKARVLDFQGSIAGAQAQERFVASMSRIDRLADSFGDRHALLEGAFRTVQARAFSGRL